MSQNEPDQPDLNLSDAIGALRDELAKAQSTPSPGNRLRFEIEEIKLELKLVASGNAGVKAGVNGVWSVLGLAAEGSASTASERSHLLKLKMRLSPDTQGKVEKIADRTNRDSLNRGQ